MEAPRDCAIGASNHPKLLPEGTYVCVVQGLPHQDRSWKTQTEFVRFTLKPIEASCDVDADALAAMGGLENRTLFAIFHLTDNSLWRLKKSPISSSSRYFRSAYMNVGQQPIGLRPPSLPEPLPSD